ncbi:MAG: carboxypeptidase regulatory-like domain-containing protein, partial [Bacteroidales bacterium]|nr:carboxypeptidase regulatory-like domain-containing protein [Bacteroidales bacterium]
QGYMDYLDNGVTRGYEWYSILGGRQDYVTYSLYGRELTVELDEDFITPVADLDDLWEYNYRSMLGYLENALFGIRGRITGIYDGKPVPAAIMIEGHDRDNSHVISDTASGVFTRLISPGIYDLKISAGGFRDTIIRNVNVIPGERTDIDVALIPLVKPPDTTKRLAPFLYPNPGHGEVNVLLPEGLTGSLNVKVFGTTGKLLSDYEIDAMEGEPLKLDLNNLGPGEYIIVFTSKTKRLSGTGKYVITLL